MAQLTASGLALFNGFETGAAPLRHALRALASEPDFFRAPQAIARLRPRFYAEHRRLVQVTKIRGSLDERLRSRTRLADGAIIGLSHLARLSVHVEARSAVAPFAVMAVGKYGARRCGPETILSSEGSVHE